MKRIDVAENLKWNTEIIFPSTNAWQDCYDSVKIDYSMFEGKLGDSSQLKQCLDKLYQDLLVIEKLYVYAQMRRDEDTSDSVFSALISKSQMLDVSFSEATSFIVPELTNLPIEKLKEFLSDKTFSNYDCYLNDVIKSKAHVLSKETEAVLSLGGQVFHGFSNIFTMIDNADLPFPEIEIDGEKVTITHGMYGLLMQNKDRAVREKTFKEYYGAYKKVLNTITAVYEGNVNKDVFFARCRKYPDCLTKALDGEDVSPNVYKTLIESVHENLSVFHEYVENKKQALKLDEMHMYDIYAPLVEDASLSLEYEDAFKLVKKGLAVLGSDYASLLQSAHDDRWIDVCETDNKRSGAYSTGAYAFPHPYVLLNYQKSTNDIFTIAHELGHAIHTNFSNHNQPQQKADYTIFVAEVASTVNEVLLLKYLVANTENVKLKKYLLSYYMDMIKGTLFRQTMFAEFEVLSHSSVEKGEPITKDSLSEMYLNLNKKYYGNSVISDEEISFEWARIPHFYRAFYVYKYATGIISAISIAERIYKLGETAVKDYFKFLSSGSSNSPVELLKLAGIDLNKKETFQVAFDSFKNALCEFKKL